MKEIHCFIKNDFKLTYYLQILRFFMVTVSEIGSTCDIQIRGKYPLFSETHFDQILSDSSYERKIDTQNNNQPFYQKEEIIIFTNFSQNTITLRLRNVISLQPKYAEFSTLLAKLGFKPESVSVLGGQFKTFVTDIGLPQVFLNKILNNNVKSTLTEKLQLTLGILSVVVANTDSAEIDLQIRIEPLNSSPQDSLYVEVIFRTVDYNAFNDFIGKFGADFISEIISSIDEVE